MKNIKNIKFILVIFAGIYIINSCSDKDLELTNPTTLSPETYFKTKDQVESSVNAAYANLQTTALYTRLYFFELDNMSHENAGNPQLEADKKEFLEFSFDSGSADISDYWTVCYLGINKSNFVISNSDKINAIDNSILNQVTKDKYIGEAKFMRAFYYFLLVKRFGGVPLYDALPKGADDVRARATVAEVYNLIVSDLKTAATTLLSRTAEQKGRATKEAAQALLGKVLLYQKKYDESLAALNGVTGFSLEPVYYDNFVEEKEHGVESIFEVEFDAKLGTGNLWGAGNGAQGGNESTLRGQEYGNLNWFNVYPSDNILDEFEANDKRFAATFYVVGDKYNNGNNTMVAANFGSGGGTRRAGWKKYSNYYKKIDEAIDSGINFKIIRYSDILLMKAECENQRAGGDQVAAIGYINQVRARAGVPALLTTLTKDQVFKAIIHERKVEFAGEQSRFDDIIRWGNAATELVGTKFKVGKNELWPIPNNETGKNSLITGNNPGW
ncbi:MULTISPECIES: RagB/SusD family nutrient uptake outer membrane protein [Flavobacterium]|uniref:RagB/SusD family nutrient uptake outer membrane protein n=1 Tax=Flavobacterium TaxID=237 RepID=UPI00188D697A|nr:MULTISPECIES: RagB/SusD family nutrient uptake outer membrane protein [Flavobacterium]MBF4471627.1 RagB/SusD family nutrient uptake outer membrane protein [Flavobacterium sp. HJJ]